MQNTITLSLEAEKKIKEVLENKAEKTFFYIELKSGGCAGFVCNFKFVSKIQEKDIVMEQNGIKFAISKQALAITKGSTIEFVQTLMGFYFSINVPNAEETCSCGSSFSI